jgi:hypothetical protein
MTQRHSSGPLSSPTPTLADRYDNTPLPSMPPNIVATVHELTRRNLGRLYPSGRQLLEPPHRSRGQPKQPLHHWVVAIDAARRMSSWNDGETSSEYWIGDMSPPSPPPLSYTSDVLLGLGFLRACQFWEINNCVHSLNCVNSQ